MPDMQRQLKALNAEQKSALVELVRTLKYEVIPMSSTLEKCSALPKGSVVTVTASPGKGMGATMDLSEALVALGHDVVPHFSARMVRDRADLDDLLSRTAELGIRRAFVVGGDAKEPGAYTDALSLLRAIDDAGRPFDEIGIGAYPEGHVDIESPALLQSLKEKQEMADYMTTQLCFDPASIIGWATAMRREGIKLPIHLGMPGVTDLKKLMSISAKIGIGDSIKYLRKQRRVAFQLIRGGSYGPETLLTSLGTGLTDPVVDIRGLHLFSFNALEASIDWRSRFLESLQA